MRGIPAIFTGVCVLLLVAHGAVSLKHAAALCEEPIVVWANNVAFPAQIDVTDEEFSTTQQFAWCGYETDPFVANTAVHNWSGGVSNVSFTPAYFFPEDVEGNRNVQVDGEYSESSQGWVEIKVTVFDTPPAQTAIKKLFLNP